MAIFMVRVCEMKRCIHGHLYEAGHFHDCHWTSAVVLETLHTAGKTLWGDYWLPILVNNRSSWGTNNIRLSTPRTQTYAFSSG